MRGERDAGVFCVGGDHLGERQLERVLVVEHVQLPDAQLAASAAPAPGLLGIAGLQAREVALAGRVEPFGLVLTGISRGGQTAVGTGGADLEDVGGVDQRQRDRGRRRVVVTEIGDRAGIVGGRLGVARGQARVPLAAGGVGVVQRGIADRERPDVSAGVVQRELLPVDDLRGDRPRGALQRKARVDGQLVALAAGGPGDAAAAGREPATSSGATTASALAAWQNLRARTRRLSRGGRAGSRRGSSAWRRRG